MSLFPMETNLSRSSQTPSHKTHSKNQ